MVVRPLANTQNQAAGVVANQHQCGMDAWYSSSGSNDLTAASSLCLLRRQTSLRSSRAVSMSLLPATTQPHSRRTLSIYVKIDEHRMLYTAYLHAKWIKEAGFGVNPAMYCSCSVKVNACTVCPYACPGQRGTGQRTNTTRHIAVPGIRVAHICNAMHSQAVKNKTDLTPVRGPKLSRGMQHPNRSAVSSHHLLSMPLARSCALLRKLCLSASVAAWLGMAARAAAIQGYASPLYTCTPTCHSTYQMIREKKTDFVSIAWSACSAWKQRMQKM